LDPDFTDLGLAIGEVFEFARVMMDAGDAITVMSNPSSQ